MYYKMVISPTSCKGRRQSWKTRVEVMAMQLGNSLWRKAGSGRFPWTGEEPQLPGNPGTLRKHSKPLKSTRSDSAGRSSKQHLHRKVTGHRTGKNFRASLCRSKSPWHKNMQMQPAHPHGMRRTFFFFLRSESLNIN